MTRQFDDFELDTWLLALGGYEIRDVQTAMRKFVTEATQDHARRVVLGDVTELTRWARQERCRQELKALPAPKPTEADRERHRKFWKEAEKLINAKSVK